MSTDKYLWVESYSPSTVDECILPTTVKSTFNEYVREKQFPNLIFAGPAGVGKTSLARALCSQIDADLLFVNASLDRGIGEVRTTVSQFASCSSMFGGVKVVLLDEADNLTGDSQKALRALIEEFQNHCRFILTCNYPHNIIDAIHSRCSVIDFNVRDPKSLTLLSGEFFSRVSQILKSNDIKFDDKVLAKYIMSMAPDWRGILNNLQGATKTGELTPDILQDTPDTLISYLKSKKWTEVRDWVFQHSYIHPKKLEMDLYKAIQPHLADQSKPQVVLIFAEYSDKILSGADPSITLLALTTQLMMEASWN
jgi:DNA polymerase III delta prime subunit